MRNLQRSGGLASRRKEKIKKGIVRNLICGFYKRNQGGRMDTLGC
jgi:hypothetical protein